MFTISEEQLLEFLNQNMHRNYPIQDTRITQANDGTYLPSSFLVDCQILIPCSPDQISGIDATRFFVSAVLKYTNSVQVLISYQPLDADAFVCATSSAIVLVDDPENPYPAVITLTPAAEIPDDAEYAPLKSLTGTLSIGSTANMSNLGSLYFTYDHGMLYQTCIIKNLVVQDVVAGLNIVDANGVSLGVLTGTVTLQSGPGVQLIVDTDNNTLKIQADNNWVTTQINNILTQSGSPIKSINGQKPDNSGNFTIAGLDCLEIKTVPAANSITINNPCAKPCCSEDSGDLADIRAAQGNLNDKVARISENLTIFINSINNVETRLPSLVASRE